jgi:hypothetical protein
MGPDFPWWRRSTKANGARGAAAFRESGGAGLGEGAMALCVALGGTLVLAQLVAAESEWELLLLLAAVAGAGFVFETMGLLADVQRRPPPADSERAHH